MVVHGSPLISVEATESEPDFIARALYKNGVHFNLNANSCLLPATPKTVDSKLMYDTLSLHGVDKMHAVSFASKQPLEAARSVLEMRLPGSPIEEVCPFAL